MRSRLSRQNNTCLFKSLNTTIRHQQQQQRLFSHFENYSKTCEDYDEARSALGSKQIAQSFKSLYDKQYEPLRRTHVSPTAQYSYSEFLSDLHILDAGCGTGNFIKEMADIGVGHITAMEFNEGMRRKCLAKVTASNPDPKQSQKGAEISDVGNPGKGGGAISINAQQSFHLYAGNIVEMPFKARSFDQILINMVLHHIDTEETRKDNKSNMRRVFQKCSELLANDGQLFISTCSPTQLRYSLWYYQFWPESAVQRACDKYEEATFFTKELLNVGFSNVDVLNIYETAMDVDTYYNFEGIFSKEWRNGDSSFAVMTDDELQITLDRIKPIVSDATERQKFYDECERNRMEFGHATAIIATN